MWAACCNWLCLDTQPEETAPSGRTQAASNPYFRPSSTIPEITCRTCGTRLQLPLRKSPCMDCRNNFCGSCLAQLSDGQPVCQLCRRFRSTSFTRDELLKMKVKDLRDYLSMRNIPTELCREKEDLVQLVLSQRPPIFNQSGMSPSASPGESSTTSQPTQTIPTVNNTASADILSEEHLEEDNESTDSEEIRVPGRRASLSDIGCVDDIEALSVRQLKEILARNFVDYKGCCEKWELMERVTRLYNEQKGLQQKVSAAEEGGKLGATGDENICRVCMDSPIDCVLLECGHMVTCTKCGKRMSECPICRQYVVRAVHVFRS
ncbi:E3 ubiquitin-protein ligase rififylin [Spea bombifrons]|uniref:E3 ubiquitin-protein ligase rififylin n=1 Tax=Spea bombifrons TaxID=233779 RepID=UPI0023493557|nr:E3 ubiquitin-protein ligase rififylin [Spea bombifrons]